MEFKKKNVPKIFFSEGKWWIALVQVRVATIDAKNRNLVVEGEWK